MSEERGSASIIVAARMVVVMVLAIGAADIARLFAVASRAQTAADAAALAAPLELAMPGGEVSPAEIAGAYAVANGGSLTTCVCEVGTFEARVEVRVPAGVLTLGPDDLSIAASARAVVDVPAA